MLVSVCFFLSGAAALILQVLWVRMLGHVFGATALAVSTTLTAFMFGLALGAHLAGRRAPKLRNPLLVFAALETAVGLYGLFVPALLGLMPAAQRLIAPEAGLGFLGYSLLRFVLVSVILVLPTTAMGATLPILAEGVVKKSDEIASRVGELYAANTAGAVAGAMFGGFVLIPTLGLEKTVYVAASIDLLVAGFVAMLSRAPDGVTRLIRRRRKASPNDVLARLEPVKITDVTPAGVKAAVLGFALSGAAAMALQVLWTRTIGVVIGASTYAFTLILTTFLVGLTAGAALISRVVDRVTEPVKWLARIQLGVGVAAILGTILVDRLPMWVHATAVQRDVTIDGLYFTNFVVAAVVMLPATFALGAVMPLVVRIITPPGETHAGPVVGRAYVYNTAGAIVGSFAGGFILLPWAGVQNGIAIAAGLSIAVAAMLGWFRPRKDVFVLGAATLALLVIMVMPRWDVSSWTAGMFRIYLARHVFADGWEAGGDLIYHRDGISTTVTVERSKDTEGVWLKVNGKVDASDIGDMPTQVLSGLLPVLVHGEPERVLVIGYGSGVTPGAVLQAPVQKVTLVEIEEAVLEAADTYFAHVNNRPFEDPRYTAVVDDGRNYLLTRDDTYDVIISEPSNPWMSGASSLFTTDFFTIAKRRLDEGGVFLQWLQLYELSPENIHAILRTFNDAFPYVMVFTPSSASNDTLLVGAREPIQLHRSAVVRALADERYARELKRGGVESPEDLIGLFVVGWNELKGFVGEGPLNTDDNALIEFAAPRDLIEFSDSDARLPFVDEIDGKRRKLIGRYLAGYDLDDPQILARASSRLVRQGRLDDARAFAEGLRAAAGADTSTATLQLALQEGERAMRVIKALDEAVTETVLVDDEVTRGDERYARAALALVQDKVQVALDIADHPDGFEEVSGAHQLLYAYLCWRQERYVDSEYLIDLALEREAFVARHPAVLYYAAHIYADRRKYAEAVDFMERFLDAKDSED